MLRAAVLVVLALGAVTAGPPQSPQSPEPYLQAGSKPVTEAPLDVPPESPPPITVPPIPTTKSTTTVTPPTTQPTKPTTPTTVIPPTTTSAPVTPVPPPEKGKWAFIDGDNVTCIIVQMAVQFNISYMDKVTGEVRNATFDLPANLTKTVSGSCGNDTQSIKLSWPCSLSTSFNNMTIAFTRNVTENKFSLSHMAFEFAPDSNFPNSNVNSTIQFTYDSDMFTIPTKKSYRCAKNQIITLEPSGGNGNSTVSIKDLQVQAFGTDKGSSFYYAEDCDYVDVPDIVPIAVGCALGGLVLIVLITYLVGRRNRQARGYLSM